MTQCLKYSTFVSFIFICFKVWIIISSPEWIIPTRNNKETNEIYNYCAKLDYTYTNNAPIWICFIVLLQICIHRFIIVWTYYNYIMNKYEIYSISYIHCASYKHIFTCDFRWQITHPHEILKNMKIALIHSYENWELSFKNSLRHAHIHTCWVYT